MFLYEELRKAAHFREREVVTDNFVFRLHHRVTFWFLAALCCLATTRQEIYKEHVKCLADEVIQHVVGTYCFYSGTFTVKEFHNISRVDLQLIAFQGVGPYTGEEEIVRHSYYMWVPILLFLQTLMFGVPWKLWKMAEGGRLEWILRAIAGMDKNKDDENNDKYATRRVLLTSSFCKEEEESLKRIRQVLTMERFALTRDWAWKLMACEMLNIVNVFAVWWWTNKFFNGKFQNLGFEWWHSDEDALSSIFPKITKCRFFKYGPSGTIQTHDVMCVMSLNYIYEKIYVMMWFWLVGLFALTVLGLAWRLLTVCLHSCSSCFTKVAEYFNRISWGVVSPAPPLWPFYVQILTRKLGYSDWLLLQYIGTNVYGPMFGRILSHVAEMHGSETAEWLYDCRNQETTLRVGELTDSVELSGVSVNGGSAIIHSRETGNERSHNHDEGIVSRS